MTEKADKVLADRKERTRKQLEKLELEARRRANPAWTHWRRAKLSLERMGEIAGTSHHPELALKMNDLIQELQSFADMLGPQPKATGTAS